MNIKDSVYLIFIFLIFLNCLLYSKIILNSIFIYAFAVKILFLNFENIFIERVKSRGQGRKLNLNRWPGL